jgi:hypothetical protein
MDTNININEIHKYFSQNSKSTFKKENNNYCRTKIINYSYFSVNEATICHKISKIPYYSNYFSILQDYELLNISQLNDDFINKLKNINDTKYYLFKYDDRYSITFSDFIYNHTSIKLLLFNLINSISHILLGLDLLNKNNICFFNITPQNIIFLKSYREKPVLSNFSLSLYLNKLDYNYFSTILNKLEDFTYQPLEVNILFYFVNNNMITISYSFIEEFCENYMKNISILNLFSENYKKKYKEACIETMKKYINKPKQYIIDDILERNDKWDVYAISVIYIQLFGYISHIFSLKATFISKITLELSKNIHPDSNKRMTLEKTNEIVNKLFNEQKDWSFVNNLDNTKLQQLFDTLER